MLVRTSNSRMTWWAVAVLLALLPAGCHRQDQHAQAVWSAYQRNPGAAGLAIEYPADGAIFPPEMVPPSFRWQEKQPGVEEWLVTVQTVGPEGRQHFLVREGSWTPSAADWDRFKRGSVEHPATVTILGTRQTPPGTILCAGRVAFTTSRDPVGAPLFYREVNLPFIEAVKDPTRIRWRFGPISTPNPPPVVLENLPVCGNCHSFPRDGHVLAMDVDYANNKGSYVLAPVAPEMALAASNVITWDDYRRDEGDQTFGLLSQISPDGRYVVSTVKDQSVFVDRPGLDFSQLFFPVKGLLVVYDRQRKTFAPLPGADDPRFVQSNPVWSPDGKEIVFARAPAYDLKQPRAFRKVLLSAEECREFLVEGKPFQYDLYRIPFREGQGGTPVPLAGAATNGCSNFFPKYSPDGQWIVFCRAQSYMLLQPDSQLWIIPAAGGTARRLLANTQRMNSWHSWSPNGRWLVFSSKARGPFTQLWLTHLDERGQSSPPVVLAHLTAPDRAANIPEFVNLPPDGLRRIHEQFINDHSFVRAGHEFFKHGEVEGAIRQYEKALEVNPGNATAHQRLGYLLYNQANQPQAGLTHTRTALRLEPENGCAHFDLAMALLSEWELGPASPTNQLAEFSHHLREAVRLGPSELIPPYLPADMLFHYGRVLVWSRQFAEAATTLQRAVRLDARNAEAHYWLALAQAQTGLIEEPLAELAAATRLQPGMDRSVLLHDRLGINYAQKGLFTEAIAQANAALKLAQLTHQTALAEQIRHRLVLYQQHVPWTEPGEDSRR